MGLPVLIATQCSQSTPKRSRRYYERRDNPIYDDSDIDEIESEPLIVLYPSLWSWTSEVTSVAACSTAAKRRKAAAYFFSSAEVIAIGKEISRSVSKLDSIFEKGSEKIQQRLQVCALTCFPDRPLLKREPPEKTIVQPALFISAVLQV